MKTACDPDETMGLCLLGRNDIELLRRYVDESVGLACDRLEASTVERREKVWQLLPDEARFAALSLLSELMDEMIGDVPEWDR